MAKKTINEESLSSEYVWKAIRYLERDSDRKRGSLIAIIALLLIALSLCATGLWLYLRGLLTLLTGQA